MANIFNLFGEISEFHKGKNKNTWKLIFILFIFYKCYFINKIINKINIILIIKLL